MMATMAERIEESFGDRVERLRKAAGLSQVQLAVATGLSQTTISDIERGRNKGSTEIVTLAAALGVTSEELLTGEKSVTLRQSTLPYSIEPRIRDRLLGAFDLLTEKQRAELLLHIEQEAKDNEATARHVAARISLLPKRPSTPEKKRPSKRLGGATKPKSMHK